MTRPGGEPGEPGQGQEGKVKGKARKSGKGSRRGGQAAAVKEEGAPEFATEDSVPVHKSSTETRTTPAPELEPATELSMEPLVDLLNHAPFGAAAGAYTRPHISSSTERENRGRFGW